MLGLDESNSFDIRHSPLYWGPLTVKRITGLALDCAQEVEMQMLDKPRFQVQNLFRI